MCSSTVSTSFCTSLSFCSCTGLWWSWWGFCWNRASKPLLASSNKKSSSHWKFMNEDYNNIIFVDYMITYNFLGKFNHTLTIVVVHLKFYLKLIITYYYNFSIYLLRPCHRNFIKKRSDRSAASEVWY